MALPASFIVFKTALFQFLLWHLMLHLIVLCLFEFPCVWKVLHKYICLAFTWTWGQTILQYVQLAYLKQGGRGINIYLFIVLKKKKIKSQFSQVWQFSQTPTISPQQNPLKTLHIPSQFWDELMTSTDRFEIWCKYWVQSEIIYIFVEEKLN